MKYKEKESSEYSVEDAIFFLKDYYLNVKKDPDYFYNKISMGNTSEIRSALEELRGKVPLFDDLYGEYVKILIECRNKVESRHDYPLTGDFVRTKKGQLLRVTVSRNGETFQAYPSGSFHLDESGYISMSGTCGNLYEASDFILSGEEELGSFWFWDRYKGIGKGLGCHANAYFRVWAEKS